MPAPVALLAGLVFGAGLTISQMVNPAKALAFLDFAGMASGAWDPSLGRVMGGALAVSAPAYLLAQKRGIAALGSLRLPTRRDIDLRLAAGAVIFGVGWGLVGFCPGPGHCRARLRRDQGPDLLRRHAGRHGRLRSFRRRPAVQRRRPVRVSA
jgi:uncharacterized membrane protein YedE/YeeE